MKMHISIGAGLLSCSLAHAYAQTPEAPAQQEIQTVQVSGVRDPEMMPYKDAYELLSKLAAAGKGKIDFVIRVQSKKTGQPIPGFELALQGENTFERVKVSPDGVVDLPLNEKAYADKAEFVTNQKKGTVQAVMSLEPKLPSGTVQYGDMLDSVEGGRRALKELVPWYLRLFIPGVKGVGLCYPDKGQQVQVAGIDTHRPANDERPEKAGGKEKVYCAPFGPDEKLARDTVIIAPPGWKARFL